MDASIIAAVQAETAAAEGRKVAKLSPDRIMQIGLGFRASKALLAAVELDLFTALAAGPLDRETLRRKVGLHQRGARDFLDTLVALGLLKRQGDVYRNALETDLYLDRNKPSYVGGMLELADKLIYPVWMSLGEALRTGEPHGKVEDGEDLFDFVYADQASLARFAQGMTGSSLPVAKALAEEFQWDRYRTFVDIGAAEGATLAEIAIAHPHLEGAGFDLPQMRPVFESYVRRRGLDGRLRFHAGDFLEQPLPSADVLVMGQILHDWSLDVKRMLLAKAHAALPKGGVLIVYDQMIDDERRRNVAGLLMSLSMLVGTRGGFDYTGADGVGWVRDAGFSEVRCQPLTGPYSMIVGIK